MGVANVESQKAPAASKQLVAGIAELLGRDCRIAGAKRTIAEGADNRPGSASTSTRTGTRTSSRACARSTAVTRTNSNSNSNSNSSSCPTGADPRARAARDDEHSPGDGDAAANPATPTTRPAAPTAGGDHVATAAR
jgi:hypothetical protein